VSAVASRLGLDDFRVVASEGFAEMMDDHFIISRARNHLADALKALLEAEIMTADDFVKARADALSAVAELDDLLRVENRNAP